MHLYHQFAPIGYRRDGRPIPPVMGGNGTDDPPADPPPTDPPADPPADPPTPGTGAHGYPENTPVADMTVDQQAAYWKHQARKHEDRAKARGDYDDLKKKAAEYEDFKRKQMTDQEKAVADAKEAGKAEVRGEVASKLVMAELRAAAAGRLSDEQRTVLVDTVDTSKFLTADGEVDAAKVKTFIDGIAPAGAGGNGGKPADLGQGRREGKPGGSVASGRDRYAERHAKAS